MRLMCPNCDAEYEVDASAIPESGRDVQCSNCGHAWFQQHPDQEADNEAEAALYDPPPPLSKVGMSPSSLPPSVLPSDLDWQVESDDPEAILDAMGREARESGAGAPDRSLEEPAAAEQAGSDRVDPVPKHDLDPEALQILREEAEFETAQRALEQGENAAEPAAPVVARRVARLKGIQPPALNPQPAPTPSERLPKVETISAALRNDDLLRPDADPKPKTGRGGLFAMLITAAAATAAYVLSPDLSVLLPSLAKPLAQYVAFIDGLRNQLDILLPKGIALMQGILTQAISLGESGIALVKGWF